MILKNLTSEHLKEILIQMCKRVGVSYDEIDFSNPIWFEQYTWIEKEQEDFQKWLGEFLTKRKYTKKGKYRNQPHGFYEAGKFIMNYGWKCKYEKN